MAEVVPLEHQATSLEFAGERGPLFRLVLKNAFLTLITLGIYRFWAKTWLRRYLWSHTRAADEPLEYTGTAKELFLGFLIVISVLFPFGVAYAILDILAQSWNPMAQSMLGAGYLLALLLLIQAARFRMWRYRLSRTTWRGIRFGLDGSTWRFLALSIGWFALTALTLGLAYPWMRVALTRYRLRNTRFGNTRFTFEGSGWALSKKWGIAWLVLIAFLIVLIAIVVYFAHSGDVLPTEMPAGGEGAGTAKPPGAAQALLPLVPILAFLAWFPIYVWYRVGEFRYVVACTRFGDASFRSEARTRRVLMLLMSTGLAFLGLGGFLAGVLVLLPPMALIALVVVFLVAGPILTYCILIFGMIRHLFETLSIANPEAFDRVRQSVERGPEYGEGLADAFDVGAI